jgi:hypothetical protein
MLVARDPTTFEEYDNYMAVFLSHFPPCGMFNVAGDDESRAVRVFGQGVRGPARLASFIAGYLRPLGLEQDAVMRMLNQTKLYFLRSCTRSKRQALADTEAVVTLLGDACPEIATDFVHAVRDELEREMRA